MKLCTFTANEAIPEVFGVALEKKKKHEILIKNKEKSKEKTTFHYLNDRSHVCPFKQHLCVTQYGLKKTS